MPSVTFEVRDYTVTIARKIDWKIGTTVYAVRGQILCREWPNIIGQPPGHIVTVYAIDDGSAFPDNSVGPGVNQFSSIFVPASRFEWFVDLLRNEKPVYCVLDIGEPVFSRLTTAAEPVGEQEP